MPTTFADLATDALIELGVHAAGETPENDDLQLARRAMNRKVDAWAAERLNIYTITETTCSFVSGTQTYTVGAGGDFNVPRPTYVNQVNFRYQPSGGGFPIDFQLRKLTDDEWARMALKTLQSTLPQSFYYNPTYPLGTLTLHPIPVSPPAPLTGVLYAPEQIGEFTALNTVIDLPPGYRRMIVLGLAAELAPSYQRNLSPETLQHAMEAEAVVKRSNVRLNEMTFDGSVLDGGSHGYYIRTG